MRLIVFLLKESSLESLALKLPNENLPIFPDCSTLIIMPCVSFLTRVLFSWKSDIISEKVRIDCSN